MSDEWLTDLVSEDARDKVAEIFNTPMTPAAWARCLRSPLTERLDNYRLPADMVNGGNFGARSGVVRRRTHPSFE